MTFMLLFFLKHHHPVQKLKNASKGRMVELNVKIPDTSNTVPVCTKSQQPPSCLV